ncbi:MAG: prepilin peptidase, partial [Rubrimonas sp.]
MIAEAPIAFLTALVAVGPCVGSFAALAADRIAAGRGWAMGRSACDGCGRRLGARDLAPLVGWALAG